jgi:hypothetical protein
LGLAGRPRQPASVAIGCRFALLYLILRCENTPHVDDFDLRPQGRNLVERGGREVGRVAPSQRLGGGARNGGAKPTGAGVQPLQGLKRQFPRILGFWRRANL